MFSGASNFVEGVDRAFVFIFSVAFIFIIGITIFMIWSVIRFNRKKGKPAKHFDGSVTLEIAWTIVTLIIVIIMFQIGWSGFTPMRNPPKDALTITAIGRMWEWEFDYGDGMKSKDLVVPVNKPVLLNLRSEDVNHSLFIPAFRVKEDVIPGYNNFLWFIPELEGEYEILCTEYCGLLHSGMLAKAKVVGQGTYDTWFSELRTIADKPVPEGFLLLQSTGCLACHSIDGKQLVGPTFRNFFGQKRVVNEGNTTITITADEEYFKNSVFEPEKQIVSGFPKGIMKSYTGLLTEEDLTILTDYIKTLVSGQQDEK